MRLAWLALAFWVGCDGSTKDTDASDTDGDTGSTGDADTDTDADADADTDTDTAASAPQFTVAPTLVETTAARAQLAWELTATTDVPSTLRVTTIEGATTWVHEFGPASTTHDHWVLYWHPGKTHTVTIEAIGADGATTAADPITVVAPALPADFPVLSMPVLETAAMAPGVTVFGASPAPGGAYYLIALEPDGQVVWWLSDPGAIHNFFVSQAGTVVLNSDKDGVWECGFDGGVRDEWHPALHGPQVGTIVAGISAMHHDIIELPNGNFATLSVEHRTIADYPTSETNAGAATASAEVIGDQIVEFQRDGTVVQIFDMLDLLDTHRIGYDSVKGGYWDNYFGGVPDPKDWAHANALLYDAANDQFLLSMRHQDAIAAIDHASGDLVWILGPHENWGPAFQKYLLTPTNADFLWHYHQHGPELSPTGTITMFDNGNNRASAYDPALPDDQNFSRGLELAIDPVAMTVTEVWQWGDQLATPIYSGSQGNAERLSNGNTLLAFGNVKMFADPVPTTQIMEVDATGRIVFEVDLGDAGVGPTTYRAKHWDSLYPPGQ